MNWAMLWVEALERQNVSKWWKDISDFLMGNHRITEYQELEGTHEDH